MTRTEILKQTAGKTIYVEVSNGYFIKVSTTALKAVLNAIYRNENDIKAETNTAETKNMIWITLKHTQ